MTASFLEADDAERARRLELCYARNPWLEANDLTRPVLLAIVGGTGELQPGDFDIDAEGAIVATSERGQMIVEASRELAEITGQEDGT